MLAMRNGATPEAAAAANYDHFVDRFAHLLSAAPGAEEAFPDCWPHGRLDPRRAHLAARQEWATWLQGAYGVCLRVFTADSCIRKETLAAFGKLIAVGEFDAGMAVQPYVTRRDAKKGVPVAAHCPEPVPVTWGYLGVVKGTKHPNAARLFLNWYESKEGQIANYVYASQVPVRQDLATKEFLPYPDQVLGKKLALRTDTSIAVP